MAKKAPAAQAPIIDVTESADAAMVVSDGSAIQAFLGNVRAFFKEAASLERLAQDRLTEAKAMKVPTSATQDADVQVFIRAVAKEKKVAEAHWTITAAVSGFHRRLTAARNRTTDAQENASLLANRAHQAWVKAEERRIADETARQERENEDRAARERQAELDRMEAAAVAAEERAEDLSDRERLFVDLVAMGNTGQVAAGRAGFKNALVASARLLSLAKIVTAIKAKQDAAEIRRQAKAVEHLPLDIEDVHVPSNVVKIGTDRTTWSGDVLDEAAFVEAFRSGKHGIPADLLTVNKVRLNDYARDLHERLNRWPGVRAVEKTRMV